MKITKLQLEQEYITKHKSTRQISKDYGIPKSSLLLIMQKYGIVRRSPFKIRNKLEGKLFHHLKVLSYDAKNREYICICDCGNKTIAKAHHLSQGKKKSCGCVRYVCNKQNTHWKGYGNISAKHFNTYILGAKRRGIKFDVTIEDLWVLFQKQNGKCALSNVEITFATKATGDFTASLDRIDSTKGYIVGNIQWVHKIVNKMKMDLDQETFLQWCNRIAQSRPILF